jgi:hypothetical protein
MFKLNIKNNLNVFRIVQKSFFVKREKLKVYNCDNNKKYIQLLKIFFDILFSSNQQ